ncbi:MAG: hypothetical protein ABIX01_23740 [Chitinophagaceae bacterium]
MKKTKFKTTTLLFVTIIQFSLCLSVSAQQKGGAIAVKEVKDYLAYTYCKQSDGCVISFDSPIHIGAAERHAFQFPATNYLCYPVKVNYTTHSESGTYHLQHYTKGVYYFFRNGFGEWEMNKENEKITEEKDADQKANAGTSNKNRLDPDIANTKSTQPKIDFSIMEKDFEIISYNYPLPPDQTMKIYIKPTSEVHGRQTITYRVDFKDKAGNIIGVNPNWVCCATQLGYTEKGAIGELTIQVPTATEMKKVVTVIAVKL